VHDEPVRSGGDAIEVMPTDALGEDYKSDEPLRSVAFCYPARPG
jgi:hypothetical protein